jgi:hypothetical protein
MIKLSHAEQWLVDAGHLKYLTWLLTGMHFYVCFGDDATFQKQ